MATYKYILVTTNGIQKKTGNKRFSLEESVRTEAFLRPNQEELQAKVGYERMQEMADPALSLNRARETWQQHGRSDKWIQQRMTGQETRNKLTDYWSASGRAHCTPGPQATGGPDRSIRRFR